ncbi:hypothetical protein [Streptomyces sp. NBC_00996]|uniref:8-oxoguanine DNA glycosylase OGG fold protein n=1 Tax=Streptomyces sp. NBC_00996 TaxID=2903710 RepID=UPI00386552C6
MRALGPAFSTKLLYFLDLAMGAPAAPRALILDQRVARVTRAQAGPPGWTSDSRPRQGRRLAPCSRASGIQRPDCFGAAFLPHEAPRAASPKRPVV